MIYMKFSNPFKNFSLLEFVILATFVIYLVFPIQTPSFLHDSIVSPIGLIVIFMVAVVLFVYTSPILAILYIFVAYELLRRNNTNAPSYKENPSRLKDDTTYEYKYVSDPIIHMSADPASIQENMEPQTTEIPTIRFNSQEQTSETTNSPSQSSGIPTIRFNSQEQPSETSNSPMQSSEIPTIRFTSPEESYGKPSEPSFGMPSTPSFEMSSIQTTIPRRPSEMSGDNTLSKIGDSLEEDVVGKMAPIGAMKPLEYTDTDFKPISRSVNNASPYNQ
jgi:cytoskeletal protein RodZ